ncbi:CBS domain protein [Isoptericola sp. CG 20/1183]|uniref:CBS domain protein n=1 Tax=Isoptericola halotolerans TaxID=300560 RepID=A0ABX5EA06_9MICO|nr:MULTISPECIES: CBS domain-containing protein [Isoptericola]PRZ03203.1 CBS domain protein [Isoptericola sp. CG 20/1183]PRZ03585.1 CBS domain protein [Isoptericola halotolerans]
MLAADIMTTTVATIRPTARVEDALHELGERGITALPVVDDDGRLVGIVSEEDLLADDIVPDPRSTLRRDREAATDGPAAARRVADVMTRLVITARPNQDVARLVGTMLARGIHSVPIVMGTRVVGMLSRSDVVDALARSDERIAADVTGLLRGAGLEQCRCVVLGGSVRLAGGSAADLRLALALARTVAGVRSVMVHPAVSS